MRSQELTEMRDRQAEQPPQQPPPQLPPQLPRGAATGGVQWPEGFTQVGSTLEEFMLPWEYQVCISVRQQQALHWSIAKAAAAARCGLRRRPVAREIHSGGQCYW